MACVCASRPRESTGWSCPASARRLWWGIVAEPEGAALLSGKPFAPHKIQGWTPDFVPKVLNKSVADRIVTVSDADAIGTARALAQKEGIFCGISSGATFAAALQVAAQMAMGLDARPTAPL